MKNRTAEQFCQVYSLVDEFGGADISSVEAMKEYAIEAIKQDREKRSDDFFKDDLNVKRIKAYRKIARDYTIQESTVRDIFSLGINFTVAELRNLPIELK